MTDAVSPNHFDWTLGFLQPPNILAYAYWLARCADRKMPQRTDLDPVAMRKFTSHVGLVEIRNSEDRDVDFFIRRAGTKWEDIYGPMTGKLLREFLPKAIEPTWREAFGAAYEARAPLRLTARVDFKHMTWLEIEMLIAPLGENDKVTMLLTCFVSRLASAA